MSVPCAEPWRPLYDPQETAQAVVARQRRAYAAFEQAWRDERVALRLKGYYDQLVRDVGANAYTWWSEARWAEAFGVSPSTIKRVLAALQQAGLIRRERRFSGASRTYLTAYDPDNQPCEGAAPHISDADNQTFPPTRQDCGFTTHSSTKHQATLVGRATPATAAHGWPPQQRMPATTGGTSVPPDETHRRTPHQRWASGETTTIPGSRCPACGARHSMALQGTAERARESGEIRIEIEAGHAESERVDYRQSDPPFVGTTFDPTFGSHVNPRHLKSPNLTSGGGGWPATSNPATHQMRGGGTPAPDDLATRQVLEREGVLQFFLAAALAQQPPAELQAISHYLNAQRSVHDRPRLFAWLATHRFGAQLLAGHGAHGPVERRRHHRTAATTPDHPALVSPAAPPTTEHVVWAQVLDRLAQDTAMTELATWLDGTVLLAVSEPAAVVGTPNVFVRDYVQQNHAPVLAATLGAVLGHSIAVTLVVDGCS